MSKMMTDNYIVLERSNGNVKRTFFRIQTDGSFWCTHGDWVCYLKDGKFYVDKDCTDNIYGVVEFRELTSTEYEKEFDL